MQRLVSLALIAAATGACVADSGDEGMVIVKNVATEADSCTISASPTAGHISRGALFLDSPEPYVLTPLIESRITATAANQSQRTIALRGARVDVRVLSMIVDDVDVAFDSSNLPPGSLKFTSLFSSPLSPQGFTSTAFDVVPTRLLREIRAQAGETARSVRVQVVTTSRVFGDLGGDEIESVPFDFPVTVCSDCIVIDHGACPLNATMLRVGNPCNPFQDGVVDCCRESTGELTCPARVAL